MNKFITKSVISAAVATFVVVSSTQSFAQDEYYAKVSITNVTKGQIMSPPVLVSHNHLFSLFELGKPASSELAAIAEDAVATPLVDKLGSNPDVFAVAVGEGVILPGMTNTYEIKLENDARFLSLVGMLVTTNDTFYSIRTKVPVKRSITRRSPGYDAGTEANNELCGYIPGPPCGNALVRTTDSEGFVYIGNGIHGIGDLPAPMFDWNNPVAIIKITPIHQ